MPNAHVVSMNVDPPPRPAGASVDEEFIERMGYIAQADGLSRIAGRILGMLIIEEGPFSFNTIASRLVISRGSVSTNTRLLEQLGVIERTSQPGERQDYFRLAPDPYGRLLRGSIERMEKAKHLVDRTQAALPGERTAARRRLQALGSFYQDTIEGMSRVVRRISETT